jgi:hypothetical protein
MATVIEQAPAFDPLPTSHTEPDTASITPPHSADGKKDDLEGVPSELSDLELDPNAASSSIEPIEEDIEPDHYYGGGKIPVFRPVCNREMSYNCTVIGEFSANRCCTIIYRLWISSAISRPLSRRSTSTE